ncbi:MAG: aldehyde dehydrogenase family protein [bacterium]|nr:aldehyde dehydrogenase family protein [bacterium]
MANAKPLSPEAHVAHYVASVKNNTRHLPDKTSKGPIWSLGVRLKWLRELRKAMQARKQDIVDAISKDKARNPFYAVLSEYKVMLNLCDYYIREGAWFLGGEDISNSKFSMLSGNKKSFLEQEPYGVFGIISPGNYPFSLPMGAIVPALLAGNGVVWKPSPGTENTAAVIYELIRDTLARHCGIWMPFAVIKLEAEYGQALVSCKDVDKIHFTGSVEAGRWIAVENAKVRPFTAPVIEGGGSNPAIVLADADIDMTAKVIVWSRFVAMSCNNIKRVYAAAPVFRKLVKALKHELSQVKTSEIEALLPGEADRYRKFVEDYVAKCPDIAKEEGIEAGRFVPYILLVEDSSIDLLVLKQETFVPLLPVVHVDLEKENVAELVNRSDFGLGASIFTRDKNKFRALAKKLDCTVVLHNDAMTEFAMPQVPFGGRKNSGIGYTHGIAGLREFVRPKTIIEERWNAPKLQLFPWTPGKVKWLTKFIDILR